MLMIIGVRLSPKPRKMAVSTIIRPRNSMEKAMMRM